MTPVKICTPTDPFTPERDTPKQRWKHQEAHEVGEQENGWPSGDIVMYKCDTCGVTWKTELPQ